MTIEQLNPFIRYAKLHTHYEPSVHNRICYDCRLFYISEGDGTLYANGENFSFSNNTLIYLPPLTKYNFYFSTGTAIKFYVIDFDLCDKFCDKKSSIGTDTEATFNGAKTLVYTVLPELSQVFVRKDMIITRNYIAKCIDVFSAKDDYYAAIASANLKLCLIDVLCEYQSSSPGGSLVNSVREYIKNNFADVNLTNENIAAQFNYHPYHLSRIMKAVTGKTLHSYLIDYRIQMAKNYLITTNYPISTVAEKTGFLSYSYFTSRFSQKTGFSPKQYRKKHKNIGF